MDFMRRINSNPKLLQDFRESVENTIEEHDHTVEIKDSHHQVPSHRDSEGDIEVTDYVPSGEEDIVQSAAIALTAPSSPTETTRREINPPPSIITPSSTPSMTPSTPPAANRRRSQFVSIDTFSNKNSKLQRESHSKDIMRDHMNEEIKKLSLELLKTERRIQFLELSSGKSISQSSGIGVVGVGIGVRRYRTPSLSRTLSNDEDSNEHKTDSRDTSLGSILFPFVRSLTDQ